VLLDGQSVAGLMVLSGWAKLRQNDKAVEDLVSNFAFLCGLNLLTKKPIEGKRVDFQINRNHFLWIFVFINSFIYFSSPKLLLSLSLSLNHPL
jgi:hypothetical protein